MCSKTVVYGAVTAVLLVSVVLISVFVKPSLSEEFEETIPEKRSSKEEGPVLPPEDSKTLYVDKDDKKFAWQKIRLPKNVVPKKYIVQLHPDLKTFKFKGSVTMFVNCEEKTNFLFFHAKHMDVSKIQVKNGLGSNLKLGKIAESPKLEMYSVEVPEGLVASQTYSIYVEFNSSLADKLFGFYKSSYKSKKGNVRYIATTHFEPTDARAAFPCMDEPALKAKFEIVITREKEFTALSNMPLRESRPINVEGKELMQDFFQESVLMSSYLVAFVVCDFKHLSDRTTSNTLVRVWAPPDDIKDAEFALFEAKNILSYYETFFNVKFPLPKQDLIAIPDFAAGAMENWGLITYRSTSLLFNEKVSSDSNKQWVSTVVAHELAHQWFGNLVTMKWWNDLWLNEGFASFVENLGASHDNPNWKMMDQFLLDKTQLAMNLDQMSNSHPISVPVHNPNEINALFDTISYDKGATIIRMLRSFIGEKAFKLGLQNYLKAHQFANAETKDLWGQLTKAWQKYDKNAKDISTIMDTWTIQMGFPVVTIKRQNNQVKASQKHFLVHPRALPALESPYGYKWEIPFTYYTEKHNELSQVWIGKDGKEVVIDLPEQSGWFKANYGQKGFYRVNYNTENWEALIHQLNKNHKKFSDADRSGMIDDAFNLARAGQLNLTTALGLTSYLTQEKDYVPWTSALNNLGYIHSMLCTDEKSFSVMKKYLLQQLTPIVNELGWKDKGSHLQKYLRASALKAAVDYGHKQAKEEAMKMFNNWMNYGKEISPNLRSLIYSIGVQHGGKKAFNFVFKQYKEARVAAEKRKLQFALTTSEDKALLQKMLEKSLNSTVIRTQDTVAVINSVAANCKGRFMAWEFVKKNWDFLFTRYAAGAFDFGRLVLRTTSHFNTEKMNAQVKMFFSKHKLGSGERASKQSLESIQANVDWMDKNKDIALKWMTSHTGQQPSEDIEETLQELEHLNPMNTEDQEEDRGYARNDYYYQDREEPRYGNDDYYRDTDDYRYNY